MKVEIDIQRAKAIELIQAVDGKQYEKLKNCLHALLTNANYRDWKDDEKYFIFNVKRGDIKSRLATIYYPIAYIFDEDPNWKEKSTHLLWPVDPNNVPTAQNKRRTLKNIDEKHLNLKLKVFHNIYTF